MLYKCKLIHKKYTLLTVVIFAYVSIPRLKLLLSKFRMKLAFKMHFLILVKFPKQALQSTTKIMDRR